MHILFYDPVTPFAYEANSIKAQALGGTESTVIRIAEALAVHHQVSVAQHCRKQDDLSSKVSYLTLASAERLKPEVLILLRDYKKLALLAEQFPKARRYLWLHNMPSRQLYKEREAFKRYHFEIIAVSHFHQRAIQKRLAGNCLQRLLNFYCAPFKLPIHVLYNPIADHLKADGTAIKEQQLLFMSSPQKGLAETLKRFKEVREHYPEYELLIANPGYVKMTEALPPQAHFLGALPHEELLKILRESFCVFYPQCERVETFGLVYAEANAVGTPVLAHDSGAASEVLSTRDQVLDGHSLSAILAKLAKWQTQRPQLEGQAAFRLSKVTQDWLSLLNTSG